MVAHTVTPLFGGGSSIAYRLPQATRLAAQAELTSIFRTITPLGRAITIVDNLLNIANSMRMANKTVDDLKKESKPLDTPSETDMYDRDGGVSQANKDFDDLVVPGTDKPIAGGRYGKTPDGKTINVRDHSSNNRVKGGYSGDPTLEIYNPKKREAETKFRYPR